MSFAEKFNLGDTTLLSEKQLEYWGEKCTEYDNITSFALDRAKKNFYLKKETLKIQLRMNPDIPECDYNEMQELQQKQRELKKELDPKYAGFITVNPKGNTLENFDQLKKQVEKCISKYWVNEYCYCYEQRSDSEEDIKGIHCHILLKRNIKPSHFEREIRNTFKNLVQIPSKHIDIQYKKKEWLKDKVEYMKGNKTGEGKDLKVKVDKIMRSKLGIEELYYSPDFFSLL